MAFSRILIVVALVWTFTSSTYLGQDQIPSTVYEQATAALEQGKADEAEQVMRSALHTHPRDVRALGLLAVILDTQKRYDEAEKVYAQAIALSPDLAPLLNNLANHYLARGDMDHARATYLRVVTIEPDYPNANLQLARLSVIKRQGGEALKYLDRLPRGEQESPVAQVLRAQAFDLIGRHTAAKSILEELEELHPGDAQVAFSIGLVYVEWKRFDAAEEAFSLALRAAPTDFDVLYNLGVAAMRAGHLERAQEVLQIALHQRPQDVDCLYVLARVYADQGHYEQAMLQLVEAERLAPARPDLLLLLAQVTQKLGFLGDTAIAYDKYLKLRPSDDVARRERGFALAQTAKLHEGLQDLKWYVARHPKDARGLYELGVAETVEERDKALTHLDRAIEIDPNMLEARQVRASLNYLRGRPLESVGDLTFVLKKDPKNASALDVLGESYMQLGRIEEAVNSLRRSAELAPRDSKILMHYSRALLRAKRKEEATAVLHTIHEISQTTPQSRPNSGLFDFLGQSSTEQRAQYLENLQARIRMNPTDARLKLQLGKSQLSEGKRQEALKTFDEIRALTTNPEILADCARTLLASEEYAAARVFLEPVVSSDPTSTDARLDLAIAIFHTAGSQAGLQELDKIPPERRGGDYFLLRAQMLDALGELEEASKSLNRGFRASPTRPDLYFHAALFLIKHKDYDQAVELLAQASRILPDSPKLLLTQAIAQEMRGRPEEAQKLLNDIQARWPEWFEPYLINGIILEIHSKSAEAKAMLEAAIALGADDAVAYYYEALATTHATPDDTESARRDIAKALELSPQDPYVQSLAGKIEYMRKDYEAALGYLNAALRLWPDMVEAHQTLSATYRALGEKEKSVAELKEILRIKQQNRSASETPPFPLGKFLFSVGPPQP